MLSRCEGSPRAIAFHLTAPPTTWELTFDLINGFRHPGMVMHGLVMIIFSSHVKHCRSSWFHPGPRRWNSFCIEVDADS